MILDFEHERLLQPATSLPYQDVVGICLAAELVIAVDSFVLNLAAALGKNPVGLFGPTRADLILPDGIRAVTGKDCDKLGCYHQPPFGKEKVSCDCDGACMNSIGI